MILFIFQSRIFLTFPRARVAELADALDLGSSGETFRGSTPLSRTKLITRESEEDEYEDFYGLHRMGP